MPRYEVMVSVSAYGEEEFSVWAEDEAKARRIAERRSDEVDLEPEMAVVEWCNEVASEPGDPDYEEPPTDQLLRRLGAPMLPGLV